MKHRSAAAFVLLVVACSMSKSAMAQRFVITGGANLGNNDHPHDRGTKGGLDVGADLRVRWLTVGVTLDLDDYRILAPGPRISAIGVAGHLGAATPLVRRPMPGGVRELDAVAALELGRHGYTAGGGTIDLGLLYPENSRAPAYHGERQWVTFAGARAGLALTTTQRRGITNTLTVELVGRRDRDAVDLLYHPGCDPAASVGCAVSASKATAGGDELSLVVSYGFVFGD